MRFEPKRSTKSAACVFSSPSGIRPTSATTTLCSARWPHGVTTVELVTQAGKRPGLRQCVALAKDCGRIRLSTLPDVDLRSVVGARVAAAAGAFLSSLSRARYRTARPSCSRAPARGHRGSAVRLGESVGRRRGRAPTARPRHRRARAVDPRARRCSTIPARAASRRRRDHAARRAQDRAARSRARGDRARHPQRLRGRELGSPVEQGRAEFRPQHVFVWNEVQKREARRSSPHGRRRASSSPARRCSMTGSAGSRQRRARPSARGSVCAPIGRSSCMSARRCSKEAPPEAPFVERWVRHLRQSGHPVLRDCGILVRPHFRARPRMARRRFLGSRQRRLLAAARRRACRRAVRRTTTSTRCTTHRRRRPEHQRDDRSGDSRAGRCTRSWCPSSSTARKARAFSLPARRRRRACCARRDRSTSTRATLPRALDGARPDPDRSARFVRAFVRPRGIDISRHDVFVEALEAVGGAARAGAARRPAMGAA